MATETPTAKATVEFQLNLPAFLSQGIETGRARLQALEAQAESMVKELYARGNREFETLRDRLPIENLRERLPVDEFVTRARDLETRTRSRTEEMVVEAQRTLNTLQDRALGLVGVASREQVEALARDIDRLARRIDRIAKAGKTTKKKTTGSKSTAAKSTASKSRAKAKA